MTVPAWLANVEAEIACAFREPHDRYTLTWKDPALGPAVVCTPETLALELLDWMSTHVNRWLDETRVQGNREARRLWARICRCYLRVANFLYLRDTDLVPRIVAVCVRLNGLRLTPWRPEAY